MPFKSKAQQRWMFANHPQMAERWAHDTPSIKSLPDHKKKKKKQKKAFLMSLPLIDNIKLAESNGDNYGANSDGIPTKADHSANKSPAPNYRPADNPQQSCASCDNFIGGHCTKYGFDPDPSYVCDGWEPVEIGPGGSFSELEQNLSPEQAFKVGFLLRCVEEGLNEEQISDRIERGLTIKKALLEHIPGYETLKSLGTNVLDAGLTAAVGVPVGIGALGGAAAAKATTNNAMNVDTLKQEELIDTYNRLADEAEAKAKRKRLEHGLPHQGIVWKRPDTGENIELPV